MLKKIQLPSLFKDFFNSEKTGGLFLIICTVLSLVLANSAFSDSYIQFWDTQFQGHSLTHWINDGLMTIFFLLIGLELEREVYDGELSNIKNALLPIFAALGGVLVPAGIYLLFNYGTPTQGGAGIPMATDIAFAIGILALLGNRIPLSLKIFLTALAVIDDLCAILVIAVFYSTGISFFDLGIALSIFALLGLLNRMNIHLFLPYLIGGIAMWYFMLLSGVHATISGVLLAYVLPFGNGSKESLSYKIQSFLHKPVAFIIVPIFALANTAIIFNFGWHTGLLDLAALGIMFGLVIGKPVGILIFSYAVVLMGVCKLPPDLKWKHIAGAGMLAGIGFTMSIFVTLLAFNDLEHINIAKIAILMASLIAAIIGLSWLRFVFRNSKRAATADN